MPYFAPVAPIHILEAMSKNRCLGRAHLLLAHDVLRWPERYNALFRDKLSFDVVILDNSIIELGGSVDLNTMKHAVQACCPWVVVLPDVLLDGPKTVESITEALPEWEKMRVPLMVVPQGKTLAEFSRCAEQLSLLNSPLIRWWGVPRNFNKHIGSRIKAIQVCQMFDSAKHIHLLGFSDDMVDDILSVRYLRHHGTAGIDSAVPIRVPDLNLTQKVPSRGDWWEKAVYDDYIPKNLRYIRERML